VLRQLIIILAFLMTLSFPVKAEDLSPAELRDLFKGLAKGLAAAEAGDFTTALKEWRPLAEAGDTFALYNLGVMYENGHGVIQDYKESGKLYRLAAEQGYAPAQGNLGIMYYYGHGVIQDNTIAHMWFSVGAANGDEVGGSNRDNIAKEMTSAAIEKAQAMARECMNRGYKKCGY
jgi:TPR repeat protein